MAQNILRALNNSGQCSDHGDQIWLHPKQVTRSIPSNFEVRNRQYINTFPALLNVYPTIYSSRIHFAICSCSLMDTSGAKGKHSEDVCMSKNSLAFTAASGHPRKFCSVYSSRALIQGAPSFSPCTQTQCPAVKCPHACCARGDQC